MTLGWRSTIIPLLIFSLLSLISPPILTCGQEVPAAQNAAQAPVPSGLVDIDYRDTDIKEVARAFSKLSGVNIIVGNNVEAKITLKISGIEWRTALKVILDSVNLASIERENIIIITTQAQRQQDSESGELETRVVRFNFVNVADISGSLNSILSSRGKINTDARTNSLIITDTKEKLDKFEEVAKSLDIRTPQVLIEIVVLDVKLTDAFKWGVIESLQPSGTSGTKWKEQSGTTLSVSSTPTFNWAKTILDNYDANITIQSIIANTKSEILANPRVVTLDNLEASIEIITNIPYQGFTQSSTQDAPMISTTQFLPVGVTLKVTPHITKDNFISIKVDADYSVRTDSSTTDAPTTDSRKASTNVLVRDGQTIAMGGLRRRDISDSVSKIPILGDIPLLGYLFRSKEKTVTDTELVLFVTPHLIGDAPLSDKEILQLSQFKDLEEVLPKTGILRNKKILFLRQPKFGKTTEEKNEEEK